MAVPVYIMEEHNEAFYCWNYMIAAGEIAPTGNHLFHLDSHNDFEAGYYGFNLNHLPFPLEKVKELVYSNYIGIGDFIMPSIYQGIYDNVMLCTLFPKPALIKDYFMECVGGTDLDVFEVADENKRAFLLDMITKPNSHFRHFAYFEGDINGVSQTSLLKEPVVLDVDLDAFCADNALTTAGMMKIEVTKEYYDNFLTNNYHPLRLCSKAHIFLPVEENGHYYLRRSDCGCMRQRPIRDIIKKKMDNFFDFLAGTGVKLLAVDISRSRLSGYLPRTIFPWIENEFLQRLSAIYDVNIKFRPDFDYPSVMDKYVTYRKDITGEASVSLQKQIGEYWLTNIARRCPLLLNGLNVKKINSFYQQYAIPTDTFSYTIETSLCGDKYLSASVIYAPDNFLHYDDVCDKQNAEGKILQNYVRRILSEGVDVNVGGIGVKQDLLGDAVGEKTYFISIESEQNLKVVVDTFGYPFEVEQIKKILPVSVIVVEAIDVSSLDGKMPIGLEFYSDYKRIQLVADFIDKQFGVKISDELIRRFVQLSEAGVIAIKVHLQLTSKGKWGNEFSIKLIVTDNVSPQLCNEFLSSNEMRGLLEILLEMGVVDERFADSVGASWEEDLAFEENKDRRLLSAVQSITLSWKDSKWQPARITFGMRTM